LEAVEKENKDREDKRKDSLTTDEENEIKKAVRSG